MPWVLTSILLLAAAGPVAATDCRRVGDDRIHGSDLARVDSRFAALPDGLTIGFSPEPGLRRTFTAAELARIARSNGIPEAAFGEVCFEWWMVPLRQEDVVAAMQHSLMPEITLRVLEISKAPVPVGVAEFPMQRLEPPSPASPAVQLWRGAVKYARTRQFGIWARVELTAPSPVLIAFEDLPTGVPISGMALHLEVWPLPVYGEKPVARADEVTGKAPHRLIKAGTPIMRTDLIELPVVRKGDVVAVEVASGASHVRFEAVAAEDGRSGDLIELRNPASGRNFKARVENGPRAVIVVPRRLTP